jgi:hypothetical protein
MSKLPPEFWARDPVTPTAFLAELRERVLDRSDRRCPKWRFRFAPNLAIQIQPRPVTMISTAAKARGYKQWILRFDCIALQGGDLSAQSFERWTNGLADRLQVKFVLFAEEDDAPWRFKPTSARWSRAQDQSAMIGFRARVLAELGSGRLDQLDSGMMLQPACMCCGRALTDPASMARWIGPECAGTTSLDVGMIGLRLSGEAAP